MPMTRLGRAYVLASQVDDEISRAHPDWHQIAADSAELQRTALVATNDEEKRPRRGDAGVSEASAGAVCSQP
jgi:hypothetical protein